MLRFHLKHKSPSVCLLTPPSSASSGPSKFLRFLTSVNACAVVLMTRHHQGYACFTRQNPNQPVDQGTCFTLVNGTYAARSANQAHLIISTKDARLWRYIFIRPASLTSQGVEAARSLPNHRMRLHGCLPIRAQKRKLRWRTCHWCLILSRASLLILLRLRKSD
jgi:hypothetical protein